MRTRLLLIPGLLALVFALRADAPMTRLRIEVKTSGGHPIDRASVVVRFVEGRSIAKFGKKIRTTYELRTNQEGLVKVPSIPQGKILIQVIAKGYQTYGKVHDIEEQQKTVEIKLNPPQAQYSSHQ